MNIIKKTFDVAYENVPVNGVFILEDGADFLMKLSDNHHCDLLTGRLFYGKQFHPLTNCRLIKGSFVEE